MEALLTQRQIDQVEEHLVDALPRILERNPKIATAIEGILAQHFPRRDEFARLLDELTALRKEMNQRFEQVDQRFEQVDQRLDSMDQRFGKMDQTMLMMRRDIVKLQHGQELILKRMDGQEAWLRLSIGDMRNEKGDDLESLFAAGLRYGLGDPDISAENIQLQQYITDHEGLFFKQGFTTEVDVVARNGDLIVFEVKATSKIGEVSIFSLKVDLMKALNPTFSVRGVFISLGAPDRIQQRCEELGIELVR